MGAKQPIDLVHPTSANLVVTKRRVAVRIRTVADRVFDGSLYADVQRLDGSKGTIVDRLCDTTEAYLPVATNDSHVVLSKAAIVTVLLPEGEVPAPCVAAREHEVRFHLSMGDAVSGTIRTLLQPTQFRLLDYLNRSAEPFLAIATDEGVVLVNRAFLAHAEERHDFAVQTSDPGVRNTASVPAPIRPRSSATRHVLVVDDDADFRRLLDDVFSGLGYRVHATADGRSALNWLSANRTDVVLLDLSMPGMSGIEVLRAIRRLSSEPPVIVLSGVADENLGREALRIGAQDYLSKPVELRSLQERVLLATV